MRGSCACALHALQSEKQVACLQSNPEIRVHDLSFSLEMCLPPIITETSPM